MRFDLDPHGNWLVDPNDLAQRLGVASAFLRRQMKLGLVTSRIEAGSGEDEGRSRVTVRLHGSGWQGIFDRGGSLLSERAWGDRGP